MSELKGLHRKLTQPSQLETREQACFSVAICCGQALQEAGLRTTRLKLRFLMLLESRVENQSCFQRFSLLS